MHNNNLNHNTNMNMLSKEFVIYQDQVPMGYEVQKILPGHSTFLFYDANIALPKKILNSYDHSMALVSGESLKSLNSYAKVVSKLSVNSNTVFVAMGGGSLGDFVGFLASTYKRGCPLVHIPSTWLAAVDSSHGGKTALNIKQAKNQIGSYYFPNAVIISKRLLLKQPKVLLKSALGEIAKTYLYDLNFQKKLKSKIQTGEQLFSNLPIIISAKYKVVQKDPYEKKQIRKILNLGHTVGHVLESVYKLPHGEAIKYGLSFSIIWSLDRGYITESKYKKIKLDLKNLFNINIDLKPKPIRKNIFLSLLKKDKKSVSSSEVDFIFIHSKNRTQLKKVTYQDILKQAQKIGWVQ